MQKPLRTLITAALLTCFLSGAAQACTAARQLAYFGDAYGALLNAPNRPVWRKISSILDQALHGTNIAKLGRVFSDASALAALNWEDCENARNSTMAKLSYIDRLLRATDCNLNSVAKKAQLTATIADPVNATLKGTTAAWSATALLAFLVLLFLGAAVAGMIWSNAHFSGVMFSTKLSENDLALILART